jgi:hypothetical protein
MLRLTQAIIFLLKKQNFCSYCKASQTDFVRKLGLKKEKENYDLLFQEVFVLSGELQKPAFLILIPCSSKYPTMST